LIAMARLSRTNALARPGEVAHRVHTDDLKRHRVAAQQLAEGIGRAGRAWQCRWAGYDIGNVHCDPRITLVHRIAGVLLQ
jgi:hypothetical protein